MKKIHAVLGLYFIAVFTTPWFVVLPFGLALLAFSERYIIVLIGAFIFDTLFGAPVPSLGGISYVLTLLFLALSLLTFVLRRRLLE
ncbi:MAG: hypothetical protein AAB439_03210 [Patescibacteria group bacterium]